MVLVLWDLDGTLVEVRNISRTAYVVGFERVIGRTCEQLPPMAGRTDQAIIAETLRLHGVPSDLDSVLRVGRAIGEEYSARSDQVGPNGRVLPGARAVLRELDGRPDVHQSVLTGNMRPIAHAKLAGLGLAELLDLDTGAFGMDDSDRSNLVRMARCRAAAKLGRQLTPAEVVLVGDTPLDIDAAHRSGARVLAVATGRSSIATLRAAGAVEVFDDLTDTGAIVRAILAVGDDRAIRAEPDERGCG